MQGVLVPPAMAEVVRDALALAVRTGRVQVTAELVALLTELECSAKGSVVHPTGTDRLPPWPNVAEVAATDGVTPRAIRRRIARGRVSAVKVNGRWYVEG